MNRSKLMPAIWSVVEVTRPWAWVSAVLIVMLAGLLGSDQSLEKTVDFLGFAGVVSIIIGGFVLNDTFDRQIDRRARKNRLITRSRVGSSKLVALGLLLLSIGITCLAAVSLFGLVIGVGSALLLIFYSIIKNRLGILSNVATGLLNGLLVIYGAHPQGQNVTQDLMVLLVAIGLALVSIGREIVKDCAEVDADRRVRLTLPMQIGINPSRMIAISMVVAGYTSGLVAIGSRIEYGLVPWFMATIVVIVSIYTLKKSFQVDYSAVALNRLIKVGMFAVLAGVFGSFGL